jgi:PleD family two-component response regulator
VSVGVAQLAEGEDSDAFMLRIDNALYEAKHAGRNCVVVAQSRAGTDTVRASTKPA